ncbi:hypothetical protein TNCV_4673831 [Trichonephila clavipes]|nr:hypothetical protein TNCV_4673831 [Trichonephila clavipes]
MTFAFEEDKSTEKETMPARKGKPEATKEHMSRPQQTIHDSQVPTTSRAVWCQHCVRNIDTGLSLADHILAVHNHTVTVDDDGQERTEVVCFEADTVVDAANCSNTPAFNVICTEEARPIPSDPVQREEVPKDQTTPGTSHTNPEPDKAKQSFCDICGRQLKTAKGLAYHMTQCHGVPWGGRRKKGQGPHEIPDPSPGT